MIGKGAWITKHAIDLVSDGIDHVAISLGDAQINFNGDNAVRDISRQITRIICHAS